jgi:hypothetical protein
MALELTDEQARAVEQAGDNPPMVVDLQTKKTYVLLCSELYEELKALKAEEQREQQAWLDRARKARLA